MELIRKDLYVSLTKSRDEQLDRLEASKAKLKALTDELNVEQKFVDNFDKTQSDLANSIVQLKAEITKLEESIDKTKGELESGEERIKEATADLKQSQKAADEEKKKLRELEETGTPDQIAAQRQKVDTAEAVVKAKQQYLNTLEAKQESKAKLLTSYEDQVDINSVAISESNKQIEDNKENKKNAEDNIPELERRIAELTESIEGYEAEYTDFLAKNKSTIDAFEDQQLRRDANINKRDTTKAFNRVPANATIVKEADEVMKEVIDDELKPASSKEDEQRAEWIKAGQETTNNPDFLTAEQARELALANTWSTKTVAKLIKETASNGEFSTMVPSLPNNVIYALQAVGYKVNMTDAGSDVDSNIIITWENLGAE